MREHAPNSAESARVTVYIHPLCPASYRLVLGLYEKGAIERVRIVDTTLVGPSSALDGVWSVPWVLYGSEPAATDPTSPDEVLAMVEGGAASVPRDPAEAFMKAVASSGYASALVTLHGSLRPVLDPKLASAAARSPLGGPSPQEVLAAVSGGEKELLKRWSGELAKTVARSYLREALWASGGRLSEEDLGSLADPVRLAHWLLAKSSVGLSGLPLGPALGSVRLNTVLEVVSSSGPRMLRAIRDTYERILNDREYWRILADRAPIAPKATRRPRSSSSPPRP